MVDPIYPMPIYNMVMEPHEAFNQETKLVGIYSLLVMGSLQHWPVDNLAAFYCGSCGRPETDISSNHAQ